MTGNSTHYRLAVLSDVHGNLRTLEAILADLHRHGPVDALLVAGDMICGPREAEALSCLSEQGAVMILGNNEHEVLRLENGSAPDYMYSALQFSLYRWGWRHLAPGQIELLRGLPEQRVIELPGAPAIRMVHGSPRRVDEPVHPSSLEKMLPLYSEQVLICGHIHKPWQAQLRDRLIFNPGAASGSQAGRVEANYALLDWDGKQWTVTIQAVDSDLDLLRQDYRESGLLDSGPLARVILINTCRASSQAGYSFYRYAWRLAEDEGCGQMPYIPDEIWQKAEKTFQWEDWE